MDNHNTTRTNLKIRKQYLNCECQRTVSITGIIIIMFNNLDTVQFDQCTVSSSLQIIVVVVCVIVVVLPHSKTPEINTINIVKYLSDPSTRM